LYVAVKRRVGNHGSRIVLADTEGNRFCIVDLGHEYT
jgi:hypothetical protein